jgi:hypothetical protein
MIIKRDFVSLSLVLVLVVGILASTACIPPSSPPGAAPGGATALEVASASPTTPPTQPPPAPSPTSPTQSATPAATPTVDMQDLSLYEAALRPGFVDAVKMTPNATRYAISVTIDAQQPTRLTGVQRVRYTNTEEGALDAIYFRLYPNLPGYGGVMTVDRVVLNGAVVETSLEAGDSALRIPLDTPLEPGDVADMTLWFQDSLPTDTSAGYGLFAFADQVYALAGFYPTIPVYDDEGWNVEVAPPYGDATFTDVAFYQVHLSVPADLTVVTSGSTLEKSDAKNGMRTWFAVGGPMRDFYVAASADYGVVSEQVDGIQVNSYYRSAQAEGGKLALGYAADALRLYSQEFGPYPYAEFDVVATPTNAGGIEYPGAIVVAQGLYDQRGGFFELATAHEVAHQWWYGMVGNDQLDEPWLDESLTNYSMFIYYQDQVGANQAAGVKEQAFERPYHMAQAEGRDRAVAGPVASFSVQNYSAIVYGKGPLFFDAVRQRVGDQAFFTALQTYLQAHLYGIAYPPDLVSAFTQSSGQSIDDLYDFWIMGESQATPTP